MLFRRSSFVWIDWFHIAGRMPWFTGTGVGGDTFEKLALLATFVSFWSPLRSLLEDCGHTRGPDSPFPQRSVENEVGSVGGSRVHFVEKRQGVRFPPGLAGLFADTTMFRCLFMLAISTLACPAGLICHHPLLHLLRTRASFYLK